MTTTRIEFARDFVVFPAGATLDDWGNVRNWTASVLWRGPRTDTGRGGWAVCAGGFADHQLSRAGNWAWSPAPFQQRLYRWETFDEALTMARLHVDSIIVNGMTWQQASEWVEARRREAQR